MRIGIANTYYARHGGGITSEDERFAAAGRAAGAEVVHIDPLRCAFEIDGPRVGVRLDGEPLALDGLLVRRAAHFWTAVKTLVLCLAENGAVCIDPPETFLGNLSGKFQAALRRHRLADGTTPRSFLYYTREAALAATPPDGVFPLLRKPVRGSLGAGIERLPDPGALARYVEAYEFREPLMLQQVVVGPEFRALMLEDRCLGVVRKHPGPDGLGNFARGARFEPAEPADAAAVSALARVVLTNAPYDFAAVDVIRDDNGRMHVLECNRNPHFCGFEQAFPQVDVAVELMNRLVERIARRERGPFRAGQRSGDSPEPAKTERTQARSGPMETGPK
jgi:glutathione synthase/RimK-type ligase-like ATP-grasp enzyme